MNIRMPCIQWESNHLLKKPQKRMKYLHIGCAWEISCVFQFPDAANDRNLSWDR